MANIKDLSEKIPERLSPGHRLCAGCGASIVVRQVLMGTEDPVVAVCATGCLEVATTIYPYTAWNIPFMHNAFENAAATISGIETAYRALKKKGKIKKEIKFVAFGGDGGTYDIGLQSLSGALERGHNFVYVCLPPETEIILEDGSIKEIGKLADEAIKQYSEKHRPALIQKKYAHIYLIGEEREEVVSAPIDKSILSWNGRDFLPMQAVRVQRKDSPKSLIKIVTAAGLTLKLTEEHPVLIDGAGGPGWKTAAELNVGDEVYAARKINVFNKDKFYLIDLISENRSISITLPPEIKIQINKELLNKFGSVRKASKNIPFKYWQFKERLRKVNLYDLKRIVQQMPEINWDQLREQTDEFTVRGGNVLKIHQKQLDENLLYLLGLISSDGYIRRQNYGITFVNKEVSLIEAFEKSYLQVIAGRKINKIKDEAGIWYLTVEDPILYTLAKEFDIKNDPKGLLRLPEPLIAKFLRGYFDGDGHCSILRTKTSSAGKIILSTTKESLAKRLRLLLQRLGIAGFQEAVVHRFDIHISSKEDVKKFIEVVGTSHPAKKAAMEKVKSLLEKRKLRGRYFSLAPKICGNWLKEICKKHSIPITSIDKKRNICSLAASKRRATKQKISEYLRKIEGIVQKEPLIYKIKSLLVDDFYLDPIKKIETVEATSKYVYDFTIEPSHVFVPEGKFVISNCYNNEAYMNCLSLSSLIATKDGTKKITDIKVGEKVYAFDMKTHQLVLKECSGVFDNGIKDVYELSTLHHSIKATSNHPFLVAAQEMDHNIGGVVCQTKAAVYSWKILEQLKVGDTIVVLNESERNFDTEEVINIKLVGKEPTLDLRVEGEHNFIANGIVVHNTGIQRSGATPYGASTTTAPAGKVVPGKVQFGKDLTAIVAAHKIPYVAQGTISNWNDLVTKSQKAFAAEGPAFLNVLSMCHRGWRYPQEDTVKIAKSAVETGFWPLIEVENGTWRFTYKPKQRKPIEEFLKAQGRFKHLFTEQNKHIIVEIQKHIDDNWARLEHLCEATCKVA